MKVYLTNNLAVKKILSNIFSITKKHSKVGDNDEKVVVFANKVIADIDKKNHGADEFLDILNLPLNPKNWEIKIKTPDIDKIDNEKIKSLHVISDVYHYNLHKIIKVADKLAGEKKPKIHLYNEISTKEIERCLKVSYSWDFVKEMAEREDYMQEMDWAFGITMSIIFSYFETLDSKFQRHQLGRVKTKILYNLRKNEEKKEATIHGYEVFFNGANFRLRWEPDPEMLNSRGLFYDFDYMRQFRRDVRSNGLKFKTESIKKETVETACPAPLSKNKLMANLLSIEGADLIQVKKVITALYEEGYISNPNKTGSNYKQEVYKDILLKQITALPKQVSTEIEVKKINNTKEVSLEEPLRPTEKIYVPKPHDSYLKRVAYQIVLRNFLAQFMKVKKTNITTQRLKSNYNGEIFTNEIKTIKEEGWGRIFKSPDVKGKKIEDGQYAGEIDLIMNHPEKDVTLSELFQSFQNQDINVYGAVLSLLKDGYCTLEGNRLVSTEKGKRLVSLIDGFVNPLGIVDNAIVALQSTTSEKWKEIRLHFYEKMADFVSLFKKRIQTKGYRKCGKCKVGVMVKQTNKMGKTYYRCSSHPRCKNFNNPYSKKRPSN